MASICGTCVIHAAGDDVGVMYMSLGGKAALDPELIPSC